MENRRVLDRLPSIPLWVSDPYISFWVGADTLTDADASHWCGPVKPLRSQITVDGRVYRLLGLGEGEAARCVEQTVTPTRTCAVFEAGDVEAALSFYGCALPEDLDMLSAPVALVKWEVKSLDGQAHDVSVRFLASDRICFDGDDKPAMHTALYQMEGYQVIYTGQKRQKLLSNSGDHTTIDWGYLYLCAEDGLKRDEDGLAYSWEGQVKDKVTLRAALGYDDQGSISYFGQPCRAWYQRTGETLPERLIDCMYRFAERIGECEALDKRVLDEAGRIGGEDYQKIVSAAWRHVFGAHKLIATPQGEMAFLSKENDSNGCIGTVDVSYPSTPLLLRFCPELVNALCRPVLEFASLPVWEFDFAPHDVGRYPYVNGQVYALRKGAAEYDIYPPHYLYPAGCDIYDLRYQMPVEECGNMLIMMAAAVHYGAEKSLLRKYEDLCVTWAQYLIRYGEDPGDQLCTDDFAGHLARNVNLSAKAAVGLVCCGMIEEYLGKDGSHYKEKGKAMAESLVRRSEKEDGTALTFSGDGWSMKYNLCWDAAMGLGLLPKSFYEKETDSYLPRMNEYGLPLDSRADYTKSDWLVWCAAMAPKDTTFRALIAPLAKYLRETPSRVAFSDWYDTKTGATVHFIARSVQGGLFMPFLTRK